jgi:hypothetical protein
MGEAKLIRVSSETWERLNQLLITKQSELRRRISLGELIRILVEEALKDVERV